MRFCEIILEAGLSLSGLRPNYLENLIELITAGSDITLIPSAASKHGKTVQIDPSEASKLQSILQNSIGKFNHKGYLQLSEPIGKLKLTQKNKDGKDIFINLADIEKNASIKGKSTDYNIGDIGEIALGVATGSRFISGGEEVNENNFINLAKQMNEINMTDKKGKLSSSLKLEYTGEINHLNNKKDIAKIVVVAAGRSIKQFKLFMENTSSMPKEVYSSILSALDYANTSEKIDAGIEKTSSDPNINTVEITSDGISDQKGTKADLIMQIDGQRINLLSVKTGPSQLGQASGHDWKKQVDFFKTVFGADITQFEKDWGVTNEEHLSALKQIYESIVIPKAATLVKKEDPDLVQSIVNGLIRYSNDHDKETDKTNTVDIVKLSTTEGSPGFNLLRVDDRLHEALAKTDLQGDATANRLGVQVKGKVNGQNLLLFKVRSYHSPAGNLVRTIIEGGPLLEELATIVPPKKQARQSEKQRSTPDISNLIHAIIVRNQLPLEKESEILAQANELLKAGYNYNQIEQQLVKQFAQQSITPAPTQDTVEPAQQTAPVPQQQPVLEELFSILKNAGIKSTQLG
jgi:hypothetical protein